MIDLDQFQRYLVDNGAAARTACAYVSDVRPLADRLNGSFEQGLVEQDALTAEIETFLAEATQSDLRAGTVNRRLAAVKSFARWLRELGLARDEITTGIAYVRAADSTAHRSLSQSQIDRLLAACRQNRHPERSRAAILLMVHAGLDVDELVGLTLDHLELASRRSSVTVQRNGQPYRLALPQAAVRAIEDYRLNERGDDPCDHLFVSQKGGSLAAVSLRQSLAQCFKTAGLGAWPLRSLRGAFAHSYLVANPADLPGLAEMLQITDWNALKSLFIGAAT